MTGLFTIIFKNELCLDIVLHKNVFLHTVFLFCVKIREMTFSCLFRCYIFQLNYIDSYNYWPLVCYSNDTKKSNDTSRTTNILTYRRIYHFVKKCLLNIWLV